MKSEHRGEGTRPTWMAKTTPVGRCVTRTAKGFEATARGAAPHLDGHDDAGGQVRDPHGHSEEGTPPT